MKVAEAKTQLSTLLDAMEAGKAEWSSRSNWPFPDAADEGWSFSCLDLPGCQSRGESREAALTNIREAILLWLEVEAEGDRGMHVQTPCNWLCHAGCCPA